MAFETTLLSIFIMYLACGFLAGALIGCIGIGGVVLVPLLVYFGDVDIKLAISAAMFAYIVSGLVGTFIYAQSKSIQWSMALILFIGAAPGALLGSWLVAVTNDDYLKVLIGFLAVLSGVQTLRGGVRADHNDTPILKAMPLIGIGTITGVLSSLTGTGGPLVLVPLLMWLRLPVLVAIGLSQAIQLPIATFATAANLLAGNFNWIIAVGLAAGISTGSLIGAKVAHRLPTATLKVIVAVVLTLVGGFLFIDVLS
ncbi:sulfite exporter TauE/SafE family protein [Alphaproteobacteria bacterium]|nr:sulfite exporter TauE/SafE family protein [Alphaproteobacteria bacterium]